MRKRNILLGLLLAGGLGLSLMSCGKAKGLAVSFEEAYNTSVLSGIGLLSESATPKQASLASLASYKEEREAPKEANGLENLTDSFKKEIIDNLAIAENTLDGEGAVSPVTESDKEGYESMYTITRYDLDKQKLVYTFYYNELKDKDTDELDDEDEVILEGIVINGDTTYKVRGKKEIENDEEENEFRINLDNNNYVVIETEREGKETEYSYSKYENGRLVYEEEVEYEVNKKGEVELSFESEINGVEVEYSYKFKTVNGEKLIDCEIEKENKEYDVLIKKTLTEDGKASYEFISYKESLDD